MLATFEVAVNFRMSEDDDKIFSDKKYYSVTYTIGNLGDGDCCDSLEKLEATIEEFICYCYDSHITHLDILNFTSLNIQESMCGGFLSGKDLKDETVDPEHLKTYAVEDNSLNAFC